MKTPEHCLIPEWPAPPNVCAWMTTRHGGISQPPFASLNLGEHVGDDPQAVAHNRKYLQQFLPQAPRWLEQIHGVTVVRAENVMQAVPADASLSRTAQVVCAVMTADCLPVLLCDRAGSVVAAAHAGWRGLCDGVLEATVQAMGRGEIMAWLGAAIGANAFEVGDDVRAAFLAKDSQAVRAFRPHPTAPGKWWADLNQLARQRLARVGVQDVYGGHWCSATQAADFFSYRRDGKTGRMAAMIWLSA